ncbi:hypothetical protein Tco_0548593 [Tanacetum coccineum]
MSTLVEFMIVDGVDNGPPMLDKPQYESWKSRMEFYIQGLPPDVYALVNHHKIAKDIRDKVKLLILHDDLEVTAAKVCVTAAKLKITVLLHILLIDQRLDSA